MKQPIQLSVYILDDEHMIAEDLGIASHEFHPDDETESRWFFWIDYAFPHKDYPHDCTCISSRGIEVIVQGRADEIIKQIKELL